MVGRLDERATDGRVIILCLSIAGLSDVHSWNFLFSLDLSEHGIEGIEVLFFRGVFSQRVH